MMYYVNQQIRLWCACKSLKKKRADLIFQMQENSSNEQNNKTHKHKQTHGGTSLISRLHSGFYAHREDAGLMQMQSVFFFFLQAQRPGTLLARLYCALAVTYKSSLGASRDLVRGFCARESLRFMCLLHH